VGEFLQYTGRLSGNSIISNFIKRGFDMNKLGLCGTLCLFFLTSASQLLAQQVDADSEAPSREESVSVDLVATISAINPETREVQLEDGQGKVRTLIADPRVLRFDELKVGDQVHATIEVSMRAELREPTAEELAHLGEATVGVVRSPGEGPLTGSMAETATSIVTVVGLNLLNEIITVLSVDGELIDVRAQSEENLKQLRLGDTIVVSETTSIVASVVPVAAATE
jgi:hypothetical protein